MIKNNQSQWINKLRELHVQLPFISRYNWTPVSLSDFTFLPSWQQTLSIWLIFCLFIDGGFSFNLFLYLINVALVRENAFNKKAC